MSVEISGPKGYEWQYRITALIALQNIKADELLVETPGSEDAKLRFNENSDCKVIEFQAKSSRSAITPDVLCRWLAHFPAKAHTDSLLERVINDKNIAVIAARGRCSDAICPLLQNLGCFHPHPKSSDLLIQAILDGLHKITSAKKSDTNLEKDRKAHLRALTLQLNQDKNRVDAALQRVVIWESTSPDTMDMALKHALQKGHRVPQLECENAILKLDQAIRAARDSRGNVLPEIRRCLSIHSADALLGDVPHLPNEKEILLRTCLRETNKIQLTGRSQCGKTHMAKFLAQQMQNEGIHARIGSDANEAFRFLTELNEEQRLFLLDDPFDEKRQNELIDIAEIIRRLVAQIKSHRFLIVTTAIDKVSSIASLLAPLQWIDLSVIERDALMQFWSNRCTTVRLISADVTDKLRAGLAKLNPEELPQPGHLLYLSQLPNLENKSPEELIRLARFDTKALARLIVNRSPISEKIHFGLCAGASTVRRITKDELGYLISQTVERPGFQTLGFTTFGPRETPKFPSPVSCQSLSDEECHELQFLEQSGHIRIIDGRIEFAHPDYLAASKEILASASSLVLDRLLAIVERGLASLDEGVAVNSASILNLVYQHHGTSADVRRSIFEIADNGCGSIFPAVRDAVADTLIEWLPTLDQDFCMRALRRIAHNETSGWKIYWRDETPWTSSESSFEEYLSGPTLRRIHFDDEFLCLIINPDSELFITPSMAWDLVHYLESQPTTLNASEILVELMKQSHAFIRSKTIKILIARHINEPQLYLATIFGERNTSVLRDAITQIIRFWNQTEPAIRDELLIWLKENLSKTAVATSCSPILVDFGEPYSSSTPNWLEQSDPDRKALWVLWSKLMPIYLFAITNQPFGHNSYHMYQTMEVAGNHLDSVSYGELLEAWITWIEGQLRLRRLDESELSVAELFFSNGVQGDNRERLISKILRHTDTGFVVTTVRSMVDHWISLSAVEMSMLELILQSDRTDSRWLRAVAITRKTVPGPIQALLLGRDNLLSDAPETLLDKIPSELLSDAVHVFCGSPQPLWWYALHSQAGNVWKNVLKAIMKNPEHQNFDLAVNEQLFKLQLGGTIDSEFLMIWENLCNDRSPIVRRRLFEHLLKCSVEIVGFNANGIYAWEIFFNQIQDPEENGGYVTRILDNLERISINVDSIDKLFGKSACRNHIFPKMTQELIVLKNLNEITSCGEQQHRKVHIKRLEENLRNTPPRLIQILDFAKDEIDNLNLVEAQHLTLLIKEARENLIEKSSVQREIIEHEKNIWNWVETCLND